MEQTMTYHIRCVYNQFLDLYTCSDLSTLSSFGNDLPYRKMTLPISNNNLLHLSKGKRKLNNKTPHPPIKASGVRFMRIVFLTATDSKFWFKESRSKSKKKIIKFQISSYLVSTKKNTQNFCFVIYYNAIIY